MEGRNRNQNSSRDVDSAPPKKRSRLPDTVSKPSKVSLGNKESHSHRKLEAVTERASGFSLLNTFATSCGSSLDKRSSPSLKPLRPPPPRFTTAQKTGHEVAPTRRVNLPENALDPSDMGAVGGPSRNIHEGRTQRPRKLLPINTFAIPPSPSKSRPTPSLQRVSAFQRPAPNPPVRRAPKPLLTPPRPSAFARAGSPSRSCLVTPPSERAASLFGALNAVEPSETGRKLLDCIPPPPTLGLDWEGETATGPESWSPRKRKSGYLIAGLASKASNTVSASRTEHTLWLHTLSRRICSQSQKLARPLLAKLLQPSIRLVVLETLPLRASLLDATTRHWEENKIVLARCRILVSSDEDIDHLGNQVLDRDQELTPDLVGLVLFSLHSHPTASASATLHIAPPSIHCKRFSSTDSVSVFLPTIPHDLRFVLEHQEMWLWEPCREIVLPVYNGPTSSTGAGRTGSWEGDEAHGEILWDSRPLKERKLESENRERVHRALVCSRFGFVV